FRSGVTHTILERERLAPAAVTLPHLLSTAGYTCGIFGKWHLGDEDAYQPGRRGFDRVFIHGAGGIGQTYPGSCGDVPGNTYFDPVIRSDGTFVRTKGYCTDVFFAAALDWIDRCRREGQPFFCQLATNAPHGPLVCPPGSDTKYLGPLAAAGVTDPRRRSEIASFYGMIENVDTNVGRLLDRLDGWGIADDTLVIFMTDNGTATGAAVANAGMRGQKGSPYRGGTRVPSLWRWRAALPAGIDVPAVTAHIDVLPTLCELAAVTLPAAVSGRIEGRSLLPLLEDTAAPWPDRPLITHVGRWDRGQAAESAHRDCRVREGRWQLVNTRNRPDAWELYDVVADPGERHDVAADHADVVARLAAGYDAWWADVQPALVNERCAGPAENPFKVAFRRQFGRQASAAPQAVLVSAATERPAAAAPAAGRKPNIVFFLCDDLGSGDLGVTGSRHIQTPTIDALFARGTRLTRHWSGSAVCAPSRCVLLTGKHPGHAAIRSNREVQPEGQFPMPAGTVTLAGILREAGYATGAFGKWGLGPPGSMSDPLACGFERFFGYNCQREAHGFYPGHLWRDRQRVTIENPSLAGDAAVARGGQVPAGQGADAAAFARFVGRNYSADLIAVEYLAFIREHAEHPFFLYVPTTVPHLALQVPADEPSLGQYEARFGAEKPYLGGAGYVPCRRPLATYAAMVTRLDREVSRIVSTLDELGLTEDTIFVFSSDNGATRPGTGGIDTRRLESNGPLRDWKGSPYEGGLRVPTAIAWPGRIQPGRAITTATGFEDWLPTLLDLAGLHERIPAGGDGLSLAAAVEGRAEPPAERLLYRELTAGNWQAVTDGRWKAIGRAAAAARGGRPRTIELFDLEADPAEATDLAAAHPKVVARLEATMNREHVPHPDWPLPFADEASHRAGRAADAAPTAADASVVGRPARRPNILFVIADDQSPLDLRVYDPGSRLETPVIDSLAARGMVLDAACHMGSFSGAVCTPSRHMIMTGRSLWHLPIGPDEKTG
ncbi:MAG: hypothetical protein FJ275_04355, partial [Planctomycetes bacterium]|nr:hypothetical protein [Planctomycetota bacterium]